MPTHLNAEMEALLFETWKKLFVQVGTYRALSKTSQDYWEEDWLILVSQIKILLEKMISVWLFPSYTRGQHTHCPHVSLRSIALERTWLVKVETLFQPLVKPYEHDIMKSWSSEEIQQFFFQLIILDVSQ